MPNDKKRSNRAEPKAEASSFPLAEPFAIPRERPQVIEELFGGGDDLDLKTETPAKMVLPLVRLRMLQAMADPNRKQSLIEIFIREFDRRMISLDRKGRLEALAAFQAYTSSGAEEEELSL